MISPPEIVSLPAQPTAFIPLRIPREKMPEVMGPAIHELLDAMQAQGIRPSGPLLCHHHRLEPGVFDFALSFPVNAAVQAQGRMQPGVVPARKVARTVYSGAYEGLPQAWMEFMGWVERSGHKIAEDFLEVYVVGPESSASPADWRTELQRPLLD